MKLSKPIAILVTISALLAGGAFLYLNGINENILENNKIIEIKNTTEQPVGLSDDELKEEIGQMIITGFRGTAVLEDSDMYKTIKNVKLGGVVLFDYDVSANNFPRNIINYEQTKQLISDIQRYSKTPLFVAVDAEGGNVNRLKQKYGFLPITSAKIMGQDKTLQITYKESTDLAIELKELGFNMNLAPVVDVNLNPNNPIIGAMDRSFSPNATEVFYQAKVFIENLQKNNVIAVAKHFPGQGSATKDSHNGQVDVTNEYQDEELLPYQNLNAEGLLKAVMVAHIINKNIDKENPATLSEAFLQNILRKQIGFEGIIISDDMQMGAISGGYNFDDAIILAVNAGVDIIAVSNNSPNGYDKDLALKIVDIIFNGVKSGKIKEQRIKESYNRIINLKREFGIISSR